MMESTLPKWQAELAGTPAWLLQTFIGVLVVVVLSAWLLKKTRFGTEFWHVLRPCLDKKSNFKVLLVLAVMLVLLITEIRLFVLNTFTSNGIYTAMQDLDVAAFWTVAFINAGILLLRTVNVVLNDFFDQALAIKWSERLNALLVSRWLADKNYHRLQMLRSAPDNIEQRIQQDAQDFIASTFEFIRGMLNSVLSTVEFTLVLWGLAGALHLFGFTIPKGLVYFIFIFVIVATAIAMWIGNPLIKYNYQNEQLNGDYRYSLIRIRDNSESIAFYHGEWREQKSLSMRFGAIIRNRWLIVRQSLMLTGFNDIVTQSIKLLPILLQAPRLFAGQIKIGDIQQTVLVFVRLQNALSFFRNFYKQFTVYRARLERLYGFMQSMDDDSCTQLPQQETVSDGLRLQNATLYRADGEKLIENISLVVSSGQSLLIQGPSGCGKTSLLRMMAGLWPFGSSGSIRSPRHEDTMFVPQRAYVPQGSLREAVCYPNIDPHHPELAQALTLCRLEKLIDKLDEVGNWQQTLSPGELQRVAFARILLGKPKLILLDEATSALDEPTEAALYRLLRRQLPHSIIVSIGHRGTLAEFHDKSMYIARAGCAA